MTGFSADGVEPEPIRISRITRLLSVVGNTFRHCRGIDAFKILEGVFQVVRVSE
jgi:hypothetical protein